MGTFDTLPRPAAATRRGFLGGAAGLGLGGLLGATGARAQGSAGIVLPFGNGERPITESFPDKGPMILQRSRPPQLETPFEVFDQGIFTPNDRFFVRWHLANIPTEIDPASFRITVRGKVDKPIELTLDELTSRFERVEVAAVNQCSGNSRGFFAPRVVGAQWANGAMGNARWTGVRLKDVLDRAGVSAGAAAVRFTGLDRGVLPATPQFRHSLAIDHARDGEVIIAFQMNGETLPWLNGYPVRLVVPGWYATYWVKMLTDIEVLDKPDDTFWMTTEYQVPDTPHASVKPGQTGFRMVPAGRMVPRSFFTNVQDGAAFKAGVPIELRGIAFGGDAGVANVRLSTDGGRQWEPARLGPDLGRYSFREWKATLPPAGPGPHRVMVSCTSTTGVSQPLEAPWNPGGLMRNVVESVTLKLS